MRLTGKKDDSNIENLKLKIWKTTCKMPAIVIVASQGDKLIGLFHLFMISIQ